MVYATATCVDAVTLTLTPALADDGAVRPLASCPSLRLLHLAGNALCSRDDAVFVGNGLRQILGDRVDVDCALVASCARNCVG